MPRSTRKRKRRKRPETRGGPAGGLFRRHRRQPAAAHLVFETERQQSQQLDAGTSPAEQLRPRSGHHQAADRRAQRAAGIERRGRSEEHTSELQSLMRISYAVFCLKKKTTHQNYSKTSTHPTPTIYT